MNGRYSDQIPKKDTKRMCYIVQATTFHIRKVQALYSVKTHSWSYRIIKDEGWISYTGLAPYSPGFGNYRDDGNGPQFKTIAAAKIEQKRVIKLEIIKLKKECQKNILKLLALIE